MMDGTWLEIDLEAIRSNVGNLRSLLKPSTQFMAVVKANAYGHGLIPVAYASIGAGANWLGVHRADEALALRAAGITQPILVLGVAAMESLADLAQADVSVVVSSEEWCQQARPSLQGLPKPLRVHLKIETGTHRLGVDRATAVRLGRALSADGRVVWEGTYSHLAAVEEPSQVLVVLNNSVMD